MIDYNELVKALRHLSTGRCDDLHGCEPCAIYETCLTRCVLDAAAAIEALQAEVDKRISGVFDKTGKMIHAGDKVKGLFWLGEEITGVCTFREGAYGIRWMRGGAEEFTAFCQCCNVEWEVQE